MFPILSVGKANDAGKLSLLRGGMWKGANGKWYSLSWGGNGSKGGRTLVISEAETFGAIGDAMSVVEGSVALNNLIDALGQGNNNAAIRAASDLAAVFVGAAGGSIGLIVATGYGVVMNIRDHTIDYVSPPYDSPSGATVAIRSFRRSTHEPSIDKPCIQVSILFSVPLGANGVVWG
jgi:hypothetical protein